MSNHNEFSSFALGGSLAATSSSSSSSSSIYKSSSNSNSNKVVNLDDSSDSETASDTDRKSNTAHKRPSSFKSNNNSRHSNGNDKHDAITLDTDSDISPFKIPKKIPSKVIPKKPVTSSSPSNGGGWMASKKVGRDDARIEADKKRAGDELRRRKGLKTQDEMLKAKKAMMKKKRRNSYDSEDSEGDEEDDSFIVHSDDEDEDEGVFEDDDSDDDSSDESDDSDTPVKKSNSKKGGKKVDKKKKSKAKMVESDDSETGDEGQGESEDEDDDLTDDETPIKKKPFKSSTSTTTTSKFFQKKKDPQSKEETIDIASDDDEDSDIEIMGVVKTKKNKDKKGRSSKIISVESEDEEEDMGEVESEADDVDEDEDEDEDEKDSEERQLARDQKEVVELLARVKRLSNVILSRIEDWAGDNESGLRESNEDGNDDDDDGSDYADKTKKKKATNAVIIDGALSLTSMKSPAPKPNNTNPNSSTPEESPGGWIPNTTIQRICPGLELADYQLLGVNWLAMLSRLTFSDKVRGSKDASDGSEIESGEMKHQVVNGILGDEMGLGKTVQTIAFLAWYRENELCGEKDFSLQEAVRLKAIKDKKANMKAIKRKRIVDSDEESEEENVAKIGAMPMASPARNAYSEVLACEYEKDYRPHIIIVPASTLDNWLREFARFCPSMVVIKYHGTVDARAEIQEQIRKSMTSVPIGRRLRLDVVLTTFSYFSSEKDDDRKFLRKVKFSYMVVDEAHCLKSPTGQRYVNMNKFDTKRRLLLTGTPVQNSPDELMSLLCFMMPLFSKKTHESVGESTRRMLSHFIDLSKKDNSTKEQAYGRLKKLMAPFVLRRKKMTVLSQIIKPKVRKLEVVPFAGSEGQRIYDSILAKHLEGKINPNAKIGAGAGANLFTDLRKAANNPLLLRTRWLDNESIEELSHSMFIGGYFGNDKTLTQDLVKKQLMIMPDYGIHCACATLIEENSVFRNKLAKYILVQDDLFASPKFERLRTLLPELKAAGHRILLFSQWTSILDLLEGLLDYIGFKFFRLDGQTAINARQDMIDKFTKDPTITVFLLSTRAGGMGINLTAADTVIIHDLDFNPTSDMQAEDRCHRIGQSKEVTVIKMVSEGTVDEDIHKMQARKMEMMSLILEEEEEDGDEAKVTTSAMAKKEEAGEVSLLVKDALSKYMEKQRGGGSSSVNGGGGSVGGLAK